MLSIWAPQLDSDECEVLYLGWIPLSLNYSAIYNWVYYPPFSRSTVCTDFWSGPFFTSKYVCFKLCRFCTRWYPAAKSTSVTTFWACLDPRSSISWSLLRIQRGGHHEMCQRTELLTSMLVWYFRTHLYVPIVMCPSLFSPIRLSSSPISFLLEHWRDLPWAVIIIPKAIQFNDNIVPTS